MKQSTLMSYFKRPRLEEDDTPLPPTEPGFTDSACNTVRPPSPVACSPPPVLSPGQPDVALPTDLSAIEEPPSQPHLKEFIAGCCFFFNCSSVSCPWCLRFKPDELCMIQYV